MEKTINLKIIQVKMVQELKMINLKIIQVKMDLEPIIQIKHQENKIIMTNYI